MVVVHIETDLGMITAEIDTVRAPVTTTNFLRYVDMGLYSGGTFYRAVREAFSGRLLYAGRYTPEKARWMREQGYGDLFAFGRPFIANPDLPSRLYHGWPLNDVDPATMYGGSDVGYLDYPTYAETTDVDTTDAERHTST